MRSSLKHTLSTIEFASAIVSKPRADIEIEQFKGPDAWDKRQVREFVATLDNGKYGHLADVFQVTGKVCI